MNIAAPQLARRPDRKTDIELWKRCRTVAFAAICLSSAFISGKSFADEPAPRSFQVKEEDTQLAKRMAEREPPVPPFEYALSAGYRMDSLRWSIADGATNVASEVSWKDTLIAQIRAAAKLNLRDGWLLRGYVSAGAVKSGANQDSDYAGSNYAQEYSRSNNRTGGAVRDMSLALGKKIRVLDLANGEVLHVAPLAGMSAHQQSFTMVDGYQTLPASGAFPGLNNSYDTKWQGPWLGMDALLGVGGNITLTATGEYHWADYAAEANWNLRDNLAHPISFKHVATGHGLVGTLEGSYRHSKNFLMNTSLGYQRWRTSGGYDRTFFASGATADYPLNPVQWSSWALFLGAAYQF